MTDSARVKRDLAGDIPGLIGRYQMADALDREGRGRADAATSGILGWVESGYLRRYMMCYEITRDTTWLDKMIAHVDIMRQSLSDHDGDGFLSWQDPAYSVGLVDVEPIGDAGDLTVTTRNGDRRVYMRRGGEDITGHTYELHIDTEQSCTVTDLTENRVLGTVLAADGAQVELIPGAALVIKGELRKSARFRVDTTAPQPCEYQVHDGMVTFPMARFVEEVRSQPELPARYHAKADEMLDLLHRHMVLRWEKTWVEVPPDAGVYAFTDNPTQRFPGFSLPHNQYLAPARTCLVLGQLDGYESAELCAERARKMARYFKKHLRLTEEGAYVWNYWDPLPGEDISLHIEDIGHGSIDIGFAVLAARRGVVFDKTDLQRFARTYVDVMWNGDPDDPRFGKRVDTNEGDAASWWEWIQLAQADIRVWDLAMAMFERAKRPTSMIPSMVLLYDRIAGIDPAARAQCRTNTDKVMALIDKEGIVNPGFEIASPSGDGPAGWTLGIWNPDDGSQPAWVDDAHSGDKAIALTGRGDQVNVWAKSDRTLRVTPPASLHLRAWYKAEPGTSPTFSVLAFDAAGKRVQYDTSPAREPTDTWRETSWNLDLIDTAMTFYIMLRNHAKGTVLWDDVTLTVTGRQSGEMQ